jgi:4-hydroxythreonine-4-phosphate dehydrogenase
MTASGGPRIAVTVGCPCGIGPEVAVVAAAKRRGARLVLVGDTATIREAAQGRGIALRRLLRVESLDDGWRAPTESIPIWQPTRDLPGRDRRPGKPSAGAGAAQLAWIDAACDATASGHADALVTGPVSKEAIVRSGAPGSAAFLGHTEHLQRRLRAREVIMAFWSPALTTALVTTHLALAAVPRAVTPARVASATYWLAWLLAGDKRRPPRVAIASLNPHAGEGGLLGREETTRLVPGIALAKARLRASRVRATLEGPIPAESAFRLALAGRWDGVVAMYHDQATIPMKLAGFGDTVNVSLALPIVRTSVDHGTAYDRAGTWTADAQGMQAAIGLGVRLAVRAAA